MANACIEKLACKDCGSSDSVQTYLNVDEALGIEWYTSFCHGECWETKGDPYEDTGGAPKVVVKSEADIRQEVEVVKSCRLFKPLNKYRGIPPEFYLSWGCRLLLSEFDGKSPYAIGFAYSDYGELAGWKCIPLKFKSFFAMGRTANVDPYGWTRATKLGGDTLWITEGEFDAIALDYCMVLAGTKWRYPVVSLTMGGGSLKKNFEYIADRISRYKHIVLVLDDDKVGKLAEQTAIEMWPDLIRLVRKPKGCKDANDAVETGKAMDMGKLALNFRK